MNVTNGAGGALIHIEGMSSGYAGIPVVRGLTSTSTPARWWPCSAPTAPARPPRS